ncbi:DOMON-like domain-containing protein [Sphingomonas sp. G-3-2-10]|uniref:DOMON-like domain-containing protein n=1 Tax=Sphingomonas sp. G-3-2-10 TaxID=2728838 RepID=UPI00146BBBA2|nr:DOMON-like domain-containing protein [Sphingomonas sp. G-3-2-10]NML04719.1 DOMON-like domain-containing protein [Sphingomonas sp. G-3-2-10]
MKLIPHPANPPAAIQGIEVTADVRHGVSTLSWRVIGGPPLMAVRSEPERTDGLWQTTCFELFVRPDDGEAYYEFNFSPSTRWAAYRLDGYRTGMADLPLPVPMIEPLADGVRVTVDLSGLPGGTWGFGLTAVIEEADGTKSYWAIAHPPGKPDFHDPACFALELPAANAA